MAADVNKLVDLVGLTRRAARALAAQIDGAGGVIREVSLTGAATVQTGDFRVYNDTGRALTISKIRVSAGVAPTGAALITAVKKNGVSIFPTTPSPRVAVSANTGTAVPDTTAWADGEYLTFDITQIGSTVAGSNIVITVTAS